MVFEKIMILELLRHNGKKEKKYVFSQYTSCIIM